MSKEGVLGYLQHVLLSRRLQGHILTTGEVRQTLGYDLSEADIAALKDAAERSHLPDNVDLLADPRAYDDALATFGRLIHFYLNDHYPDH